eukprot:g10722.t1
MQQGLLIYIALMTGVLLERANSIVPSVIAGSSAVLWLYSYRRFNHAFHLENLPLRDIKGAAAVEKRETSKLDYEAVILAQKALRAFTGKMQKHAFNTAPTQAGVLPMPSASDVLQAARSLEANFPLLWLRLAIEQIANECSAANARSVPAAEAAPKTGDGDSISAVAKSKPSRRKQSADPQPVSRLRRGYGAVVVTMLMPRESIVALNEAARNAGAAFVLAVNMGVTTSIFSDFGAKHIISDEDGEPTQMLAVSAAEVVPVTGIVKDAMDRAVLF